MTKREKKSEKQTNENKTKKEQRKELFEEKIGFLCFAFFLSLSFFLSFFPETLRYLLFTRVHTVITYFNRTYIFHFEREREGERGRKNLRGGEL